MPTDGGQEASVGDTVEAEFDGVDDLVDHDFTKLEFLMLFTLVDILGNHGDSLSVTGKTVTVAEAAVQIIVFKSADPGLLAEATVTKGTRPVVLPAEPERLEEKHDRHLDQSKED